MKLFIYNISWIELAIIVAITSEVGTTPDKYNYHSMGDTSEANGQSGSVNDTGKKQILLNAFDMSTVGHLSPGQWKVSGLYV